MGRKIISGYSGKMSRVFIGNTAGTSVNEFCAEDWEISEVGQEEDTTNTCSAGASEQEIGIKNLEGNINYTWDVANNPYDDPPNLDVGSKHPGTKLYVHAAPGVGLANGPYWLLNLQVIEHSNSMPVRGKVSGTIRFKSYGTYSLPTGEDSSGA